MLPFAPLPQTAPRPPHALDAPGSPPPLFASPALLPPIPCSPSRSPALDVPALPAMSPSARSSPPPRRVAERSSPACLCALLPCVSLRSSPACRITLLPGVSRRALGAALRPPKCVAALLPCVSPRPPRRVAARSSSRSGAVPRLPGCVDARSSGCVAARSSLMCRALLSDPSLCPTPWRILRPDVSTRPSSGCAAPLLLPDAAHRSSGWVAARPPPRRVAPPRSVAAHLPDAALRPPPRCVAPLLPECVSARAPTRCVGVPTSWSVRAPSSPACRVALLPGAAPSSSMCHRALLLLEVLRAPPPPMHAPPRRGAARSSPMCRCAHLLLQRLAPPPRCGAVRTLLLDAHRSSGCGGAGRGLRGRGRGGGVR
ncbi:uncharacterized protein SCHCODRAFT_01092026 [Schizophyllum commune H4-8]|nr:uncharacterized protein SCHCODRAFT_01092026 [Schizophyllum commune H4-8]KAI5895990.1 hypothetical protein SCHCODRAFT_01092026 [Schizophyllum commune H4-8]